MEEQELKEFQQELQQEVFSPDSKQTVRIKTNTLIGLEGIYKTIFMDEDSAIRTASYAIAEDEDCPICEEDLDQEYDDMEVDLTHAILQLFNGGVYAQDRAVYEHIAQLLEDRGADALNVSEEDYEKFVKRLNNWKGQE